MTGEASGCNDCNSAAVVPGLAQNSDLISFTINLAGICLYNEDMEVKTGHNGKQGLDQAQTRCKYAYWQAVCA